MDLFEKLRAVALQQDLSGEFPTWLLAEVLMIADQPELHEGKVHLVEMLISQINDFDPYAGAGCFDTSVGAETIQATIRRIGNPQDSDSSNGVKTCELFACCQFFDDNMENLPKTAEYIKNKLCFNDYQSCNRYLMYQKFTGEDIPPYLDPNDTEEVKKLRQCFLRKKTARDTH